jgi:hypothetical protein
MLALMTSVSRALVQGVLTDYLAQCRLCDLVDGGVDVLEMSTLTCHG